MTVAYAIDIRVVVPRELAKFNITRTLETLQVWHELLGHQDKCHVRKWLVNLGINMSMAETGPIPSRKRTSVDRTFLIVNDSNSLISSECDQFVLNHLLQILY